MLSRLVRGESELDAGQLARALSRAVVSIPMPGVAAQAQPRRVRAGEEGPALYVIEDEDGRHALAYSSAAALVDAWGPGTTAATVSFAALLADWPAGVDLVIDAGLAHARVVAEALLEHVALDAAGIPTSVTLSPSPQGWDASIPSPAPAQLIGVTREVADRFAAFTALWCGEVRDREPAARPVLTVVVQFAVQFDDPGGRSAVDAEAMGALADAIGEVEPRPVRLLASYGEASNPMARAVQELAEPYWRRAA